ncbi:WD-40 repeat-containing protein [Reticulomyxa filosa]|uniref:WD-40 repeat-containing protein n=1 Tax=Reticulomyxa filosa TaxID=46433 RepID=X6MKC4_RETFI|nr:WD-40 repeat-containing protein [Reticulomyxa filosa]|eukprot:ETO14106.1 WD-40 repeat-containing protein [Reticulomyxa filosa]
MTSEDKVDQLEIIEQKEQVIDIAIERGPLERGRSLQKEIEKTEIGETRPGINLQGYCVNEACLASKGKLPVWVNVGFTNISFISDTTSFSCPDCRKSTVGYIVKAMFYNSEHYICASGDLQPVKDNNYQCSYSIKAGLSYELKANKIRQHAQSLEDLRERSEHAMKSIEITNLVTELQKYEITVVKPPSLKGNERLLEKIQADYGGDFNQIFDIGRFTILCDNPIKLQTAVAVIKKAEQFNLIVSEDKDFFDRQSKTHHRFHNIKLYVPKHDVYVEMQATLKNFTTLEGYTTIENPKLSHLLYELIRAWKPNDSEEEEFKQASEETLTGINDIVCEWIDEREIKKIANRYKPHSDIGVLQAPQLKGKTEEQINADISLKLAKFVYDQLCKFTPEKLKGKANYVILFEYYKRHIIGETNPASCADVVSILQKSAKQELEEDEAMLQALETYVPLQANNFPYIDSDDNKKNNGYDCHQHVIDFLEEKKDAEQKVVMVLQGKSGSGKSLFCRHLEESWWKNYVNDSTKFVPVYISLPKFYNVANEKEMIGQALQMKHISKEILDIVRENISFVFILDGFDEIFDAYSKNQSNGYYFYNRFNLAQWNAKVIVTCRSHVINEDDIKQVLVGSSQENSSITTSMAYLWPFSKEQMYGYIDKFVKMNKKNKLNTDLNWTTQKYEETLKYYPNLQKMVEEPFLLQLILTVLPSLLKRHPSGTKISRAQVYEAFNEQWIDIHIHNLAAKLAELRIQINIRKIKFTFQKYCQDLGFEMFFQGNPIATERDIEQVRQETWDVIKTELANENKHVDEKIETKAKKVDKLASKATDVWKKYFKGDSVAKYILRRIGENKYQFLHRSCQEYYAAHQIVLDIVSWKPNTDTDLNNEEYQKQFEMHAHKLLINRKLLNEEPGIINFIGERIYDTQPIFANLKSRLFRIVEASKTKEDVSIAAANAVTILNAANVNLHYQNWDNVKIPHAILDRAFLEGTSFKNANLDRVSLFQAFLNKGNFTNASMNEIYFGEYAYFKGHTDIINAVQYSPDGSKIVSCSKDKTIRVWDVASGQQLQLLEGHSDSVSTVQYSRDGTKFVSCSADKTIRIWDILSGQQLQLLTGHSDIVNEAQFSPDGAKIVSCSEDRTIRLWEVSSGKQIQSIEGHTDGVTAVQFSPDSTKIVSSSSDTTIRIWDLSSGRQIQVLRGHSQRVNGARFSPDGTKIVSCSWEKIIIIWDVASGQQIQLLEGHTSFVTFVQFSPDGSKILSCSEDYTIRIWDLSSGRQLQLMEGHTFRISMTQFSPDSFDIVSCSFDRTIRIWDVSLARRLQPIEGHSEWVNGAQFSSNGSEIVSYGGDDTIRIWDVASGRQVQLMEGHSGQITGAQFSPDGSKIASGSEDFTARIWDVPSGREIQLLEGHSNQINGVQFSPDGTKLLSYSWDKTIRIWDVASGRQLQALKGHSDVISGAHFSSNGTKILSSSWDNSIRIWSVSSGRKLQVMTGHSMQVSRALYSPDGTKIVSCSKDSTARIWDVASGQQLQLLKGHSDAVTDVQFSSDGSKIVSCSWDCSIRIWDVSSGQQSQIITGHSTIINRVTFSPSGTQVISCSKDNTICVWDVSSGNKLQLLDGHSNNITGILFSPDGTKLVSWSLDKTIRLWGSSSEVSDSKLDVLDNSVVKVDIGPLRCIWQAGVQGCGLSMNGSAWTNVSGLTSSQKLLVEQRGGKF